MDSQLEYRTSLVSNRYDVPLCFVNKAGTFKTTAIVSTGAQYTVVPYGCFNTDLSAVTVRECKVPDMFAMCPVQEIVLDKCFIGSIDIGPQHIFVTDNEKVTESVVGMDLLRNVTIIHRAVEKQMYFRNSTAGVGMSFKMGDRLNASNVRDAVKQAAGELSMPATETQVFMKCLPERIDIFYYQLCELMSDFHNRRAR